MIGIDWNSEPNRLILPKLFHPDCSDLNLANLGSSQAIQYEEGATRPLPPRADIGPRGQSVGQAAQFCKQGSVD